ncbi:uncharacterized protein LY89DRAFT_722537 [Mollisia scopiformis]|uniref:Uncharacterized protein n=1 Tax=Mollisia scopiformis TaxID=149040 RepID=A0A194WW34_MOLSC|nr:uncharacterized protein LY89DRAFT_722537 [Mollisia scopiformis]KUJ12173.1 hypothetical protein LY89DRAFT_722537 [Mollisia scopiformis]
MPPKKTSTRRTRAAPKPTPKPIMSEALKDAIDTLPQEKLRKYVKQYCESMTDLREALEKEFLVQGKDIVRYHADTDSEDAEDDETSSHTEKGSDSEEDLSRNRKKLKPIAIRDEEYGPRMAKCQHCNEDFDVTYNDKGDCIWHPGSKEVDYEADIWADHDPRCHGNYSDFKDDAGMAEGFIWDCCDKDGDDEGCKSTKHKAAINITVKEPPKRDQKRKAEETLRKTRQMARCQRCHTRFDIYDNKRKACLHHPGTKEPTDEDDFWCDHDEGIGGAIMTLVNEPDYEDGFVWSCCEKAIREDGCKRGNHMIVKKR